MAPRRLPARRLAGPLALALGFGLGLGACGDDDDGGQQRQTMPFNPGQGGVRPAAGAAAKNPLVVKRHIEDVVPCPAPDQPSDPKGGKCDPKAPSCGEHLYCLQLAQGNYCEPCPERDGIRHTFRERDFDSEHSRDPFLPPTGPIGPAGPNEGPSVLSKKCPRPEQRVASSYSYSDLKLVGIVAQGTQRKVLMTMGKDGFIIKRGDCVGKEEAVVKDIGLGYVTFQGESDQYSVQLNPKQLMVNEPVPDVPAPPRAPAAGSTTPGAPAEAPAGTAPRANSPPPAAPPAPKKP